MLFLFLAGKNLKAQNPNHFVLGAKDLAGINIYSLLYDEETDVLYAGTNNGLFAYKQSKFHLLSGPKERNGESFFHVTKNGKGEVFCCNLTGQIFKITDNNYELYCEFPREEIGSYFRFVFDDAGDIYGVSKSVMRYSIRNDSLEYLTTGENYPRASFLNVSIINNMLYATSSMSVIQLDLNKKGEFKEFKTENLGEGKTQGVRGVYKQSGDIVALLNSGDYVYLSKDDQLINLGEVKQLERSFVINDHQLIGMGRNNGVRLISIQKDTLNSTRTYFKDELISAHYVTSDGTFFFGTFGNGVKVVPQFSVLKRSVDTELSGLESISDDTLYLSSYSGDIFECVNGEISKIAHYDENIDNLYHIPFNVNQMAADRLVHNYLGTFSGIKDCDVIDSATIIYCNQGGIHLVSTNHLDINYIRVRRTRNVYQYGIHAENERVFAVEWVKKDSSLYYSTNFGVFHYNLNTEKKTQLKVDNQSIICYGLEYINGILYCGTKNFGAVVFKGNRLIDRINIDDGLNSNSVRKIKVKDGKMYILGLKGFQVYDLKKNVFMALGVAEGLVDNTKVHRFKVLEDKIWILEKGGFYAITLESQKNDKGVGKLHLDSITVNSSRIDWNSNNTFDFDENAFTFHFDYRHILSKKETEIEYTLEGFYDDWKVLSASSNEINFQYLPAGDYKFKMKARFRAEYSEEFTYEFTIARPLWQRWWFSLIMILLIIGVVVIYYRNRLKKQNEKLQLINDFNNAKLTAIQSQMNPHFIFNSLNSIQALVLRGDVDNSYTYINKFSSLVRKTLNYSNLDFIELEKEVELLEIYLELEKLRFRDEFEFDIVCDTDEEVSLPPMLIQPFIENAFVHGLMHKEGLKKLSVVITVDEVVTCVIEDNGVGRVMSKEINERQRPDHESFAIEGINTRLSILSKTTEEQIGFEYEDLYDNEKATGTRLTIKIPYKSTFS